MGQACGATGALLRPLPLKVWYPLTEFVFDILKHLKPYDAKAKRDTILTL